VNNLGDFRRNLENGFIALIILHGLIAAGIAAFAGSGWLSFGLAGAAIAAVAVGARLLDGGSRSSRVVTGAALIASISLMLAASAGTGWQVDLHMYYFAAIAVLAASCDIAVILAATALVAVHHLTLNFLASALLFPGGPDFFRVLLHAAILLLETGALVAMIAAINRLLDTSTAQQQAEAAREEASKAKAAQERAEADLAQSRKEAMLNVANGFNRRIGLSVNDVANAATELQTTARAMTADAAAAAAAKQTATIAGVADETSTNVRSIAQAVDELASSISDITNQVSRSTKITTETVAMSGRTDTVVRALSDGAGKIGEVVNLISDIAGRTNLLALNATIEAARAGDAGKGFAVVASEVKSLAVQTARATDQISQQVADMVTATQDAVQSIQAIGSKIEEVSDIASAIGTSVDEQAATTREIARTVQQAAAGTQNLSAAMNGVSSDADRSGKVAAQILESVSEMVTRTGQLRGEVNQFLAEVRVA
jgi:methyl-accepting chemotaxis protein